MTKTPNNRNTRRAEMFRRIAADREELARLKVEHDALVAVAEAAHEVVSSPQLTTRYTMKQTLRTALANLATVRNGKVVA